MTSLQLGATGASLPDLFMQSPAARSSCSCHNKDSMFGAAAAQSHFTNADVVPIFVRGGYFKLCPYRVRYM